MFGKVDPDLVVPGQGVSVVTRLRRRKMPLQSLTFVSSRISRWRKMPMATTKLNPNGTGG